MSPTEFDVNDTSTWLLTEPGWPRPIINGWPIPWVSPQQSLGNTSEQRKNAVFADYPLCQVCGEENDETVFFFINAAVADRPKEWEALAMDNAVMHERCCKLAVGRCPKLRELRAAGQLIVFKAPRDKMYRAFNSDDDELRPLFDGDDCIEVVLS